MFDLQVMVPFQSLLAYGVKVHAVCPGKKSGDVCRTAVHFGSGHQVYILKIVLELRRLKSDLSNSNSMMS